MQEQRPPRRLFIVDAMAMAFRSFYAFGVGRPLTTAAGQPTSAVFGSALFMNKLLAEQKPDYLVVACDTQKPTFRHAMYDRYKANRSEMPADLRAQLPIFDQLFKAYGIPMLRVEGFEADDLIGTLARRFAAPDLHVYIVSGDKDFCQLVGDGVSLYQPKKGEEALVVDRTGVVAKFGVAPEQVVDYLAIIGDTSDNVPGVHGIGDKGAAKLIADFGSLDGVYAALDRVGNKKQRTALETHREMAYLSRDLVTIKTDVHLDITLDDLACDTAKASANEHLLSFFRDLEFRSLAAKIEQTLLPPAAGGAAAGTDATQAAAPAPAAGPQPRRIPADMPGYVLVDTPEKLQRLTTALGAALELAFDTETTGLDVARDVPIGLSFSVRESEAFYLPIVSQHLTGLTPRAALDAVRPVLKDRAKTKVGHNIKFDLQMLGNVPEASGGPVEVEGPFVDTMVCDWLLDPIGRQHGLDPCCLKHLGYEKIPTSTLIGDKAQYSMLDAPLPELSRYACEDADLTLRLARHLLPRLDAKGLGPVLRDVEMPLVPILARMELGGVYVDVKTLGDFSQRLATMAESLEKEIYAAAGTEFNVNSPRQLADILFNQLKVHEQLGVKYLKKTQSGYSTDESVLVRLAEHPLPRKILEYRAVAKLKSTYVDALPQLVNAKTGRVHTSFHQTGTATGRLSSSEPNLQNIPIRTELGQEIRKAFRAQSDDAVILSADYSQIELRLLAHLADEQALAKAFREGQDIHRLTASKVFGVPPETVDDAMRGRAKAINFGIIYGMGPRRLSAETGVSMAEATAFIDRYFAGYPGIDQFIERAVKDARDTGESRTLTGRLRPVEGLAGGKGRFAASAENVAVNSPIQGSAADLIKLAMIRVDAALRSKGLKARMLLQVHDELVFECPKAEVPAVEALVKDCMKNAMTLSVPLEVEVGHGGNWLEAH